MTRRFAFSLGMASPCRALARARDFDRARTKCRTGRRCVAHRLRSPGNPLASTNSLEKLVDFRGSISAAGDSITSQPSSVRHRLQARHGRHQRGQLSLKTHARTRTFPRAVAGEDDTIGAASPMLRSAWESGELTTIALSKGCFSTATGLNDARRFPAKACAAIKPAKSAGPHDAAKRLSRPPRVRERRPREPEDRQHAQAAGYANRAVRIGQPDRAARRSLHCRKARAASATARKASVRVRSSRRTAF